MSRSSNTAPSGTFQDRLEFWENRSNILSAVSDPSDFKGRYKPEYSDDSDDVETKSLQPIKKKNVRFRIPRKLKSESPHELSLKIRGCDTCKTKKEKKSKRYFQKGTECLPSSDSASIDCKSNDGFLSSTLNLHEGSSSVEEKRLNPATSNYTLNCDHTGDELALHGAYDGSIICPSLSSGAYTRYL